MTDGDKKRRLARLDEVGLCRSGVTEAGDFTLWLAGEEITTLLGATVGLEREAQAQEAAVGPSSREPRIRDEEVVGEGVL
jgi:hypothetical protein